MYQDYIIFQHQTVEVAQQMMMRDLEKFSARVGLL
jgi:hypothetical protein